MVYDVSLSLWKDYNLVRQMMVQSFIVFHVADSTACVIFNIWGSQGESIEPADIFVLHDGYSAIFRDQLTLYMGKRGRIERTGRFTMLHTEVPNMSMLPARAYEAMPPPPFIPSAAATSSQPLLIPPPFSAASQQTRGGGGGSGSNGPAKKRSRNE